MGLRENQLDHSSAGMCYRTHVYMGAWIEMLTGLRPMVKPMHIAPYRGAWIETPVIYLLLAWYVLHTIWPKRDQ